MGSKITEWHFSAATVLQRGNAAMTKIEIHGETLVLQVQGFDKVWRLKANSVFRLPMSPVSFQQLTKRGRCFMAFEPPARMSPGLITAGTFYTTEGRAFWDVHTPEHAIAIMLRDDHYAKLVIEVKDPAVEIASVQGRV